MRLNEVYRYARGAELDQPAVEGFPNYHFFTASIDGVRALLESGINPARKIEAVDGVRRPLIGIRSSPWKAGTESTPWHDVFDLEHGYVRYFGDHKISTPGLLGSTTGNAALLDAWEFHRGSARSDRLAAPPAMIFKAVSANGAVKGYVQFCGVAVIERVERVVQNDPQTDRAFPNYVFDLAVIDTVSERDEVDWRWIDDRRDSTLSLEQTLRYAPSAWREWIDGGRSVLPKVRRHSALPSLTRIGNETLSPESAFDDDLFALITQAVCPGQVIKTLGTARPNRIVSIERDGLWVETERSIGRASGPQLVPAWMVITAWRHLVEFGRLSQSELLNALNVKRSAFVCALIAHFPGVQLGPDGSVVLRLAEHSSDGSDEAPLSWPSVRASSDPLARPFTATGRLGKVNVRHFRQTMTHAMDVDGLVWSFFPSRTEAETHAANKVAEGHDAIVVPAKLYVPSERPLPRPVIPILRRAASRVTDSKTAWSGGALYATRLNHLFATVLSADGDVYSSGEVAEALQSDGFMIHADSIDRLRAGNGARPSDQLSFALAFFFDVDPDYFVYESDQGPTGDCFVPNEQSSVSAAGVSDFRLTQPQLVRVLAGLTQATSKSMEARTSGTRLSGDLALIISDTAALILESMSGEVTVSSVLAARIIDAWRGTDPCSNGTEPDYLWALGLFGD